MLATASSELAADAVGGARTRSGSRWYGTGPGAVELAEIDPLSPSADPFARAAEDEAPDAPSLRGRSVEE